MIQLVFFPQRNAWLVGNFPHKHSDWYEPLSDVRSNCLFQEEENLPVEKNSVDATKFTVV